MEMVLDNINTASTTEVGELDADDKAMLQSVVDEMNRKIRVGCTGCGYCMPCPKGVDIPGSFAAYNRQATESKFWGLADYFMATGLRKNSAAVSNCIGCGKCEQHCPQGIPIRAELKNVAKTMEGPLYKIGRRIALWLRF